MCAQVQPNDKNPPPAMVGGKPNFSAYLAFVPNRLRLIGWSVLLAGAQGSVIVALGLSVRQIFDHAVPAGDLRAAALLCGGLLLVYGVEILLESTATTRISDTVRRAMLNLRTHLAAHALRLPRAFYSRSDIASLHVDWVQETGRVEAAARGIMTIMVPHLASALAVACFMLALNVWLSLLVWLVLVLGLVAILRIRPRVRSAVHKMHTTQRHFSKHVLFLLEMMDLIRLKNAETDVYQTHQTKAEASVHSMHKLVRARIVYNAVLRLMITLMLVVLLLGGSYLVLAAEALTLGGLLAFFAVAGIFRTSLNQVLAQLPMVMDATEALRRISRFLAVADRQPYQGREPCPRLLPLQLEGVTFAYDNAPPLIRELDLMLPAGNLLVLTGPSGAGKSSLALLCLGWYHPTQGRLRAAGIDYDQLHMGGVRRRTGVVLQDPWIFAGSLYTNLTFGLASVADEEIAWALAMAEADEYVAHLPQGLQTPVGERGVRLSGGEKQRLAIARALLGRPELLILDEPDNHLDSEFLDRLLQRLQADLPNCGIMLITHTHVALKQAYTRLHLTGQAGEWQVERQHT